MMYVSIFSTVVPCLLVRNFKLYVSASAAVKSLKLIKNMLACIDQILHCTVFVELVERGIKKREYQRWQDSGKAGWSPSHAGGALFFLKPPDATYTLTYSNTKEKGGSTYSTYYSSYNILNFEWIKDKF